MIRSGFFLAGFMMMDIDRPQPLVPAGFNMQVISPVSFHKFQKVVKQACGRITHVAASHGLSCPVRNNQDGPGCV